MLRLIRNIDFVTEQKNYAERALCTLRFFLCVLGVKLFPRKSTIQILTTLIVLFFIYSNKIQAQKDTANAVPLVGLHVSVQMPGGDLSSRFGYNMNVGMPIMYKFRNGIIVGVEGNYFFGKTVKEDVLSIMRNKDGTITSSQGDPAKIRFNERGWMISAVGGKVFNLLSANKNSGVFVLFGVGYMQHKVKLIDVGRNVPQIFGDKIKGYDRLTGGICISQTIGYLFMAKNKLANIYFGFEAFEAFTKGLRGYQYDLMHDDSKARVDILYGFRLGWMLPIYKKAPKEFYYY